MGLLKRTAEFAFHYGGGLAWVRGQHRGGLRVLMYHRFPVEARAGLQQQCEHFRKHYTIVSLPDAVATLRQGQALPRNSLAITVDDGYRDFFTNAFPIFQAFQIPALVFLTTDFIDRKSWMWWDQIEFAMQHSAQESATLTTPDGPLRILPRGTPAQQQEQCRTLVNMAKRWPNAQRLRLIAQLGEAFGVRMPAEAPPQYAPLTWEEIRQATAGGMQFGGHTLSHPILARVETAEQLKSEIAGCKTRIDKESGAVAQVFCYPNGQEGDFTAEAVALAREAGYTAAVTAESGIHSVDGDPFRMKRIGAEPDLEPFYFARRVAGYEHAR